MKLSRVARAFLVATASLSPAHPAVWIVDPGGGGDFADIQSAIDAAGAGDTVLVRAGEYVISEPINFNKLHDPANPASPALKDLIVRSEAGPDATTIRMSQPLHRDLASVVLFVNEETTASVLEGFRLTGGSGSSWQGSLKDGGGLLAKDSSPTLGNLRIEGNKAVHGGGVHFERSSATITGCTISGNSTTSSYGGVSCTGGSPTFVDCTISDSEPGVWCEGSSPTFTDCTITKNIMGSNRLGAGMHLEDSFATLVRCKLSRNLAWARYPGGAAIQAKGGATHILDCEISWNSAPSDGDVLDGQNITLVGCKIFGNIGHAASLGGSSSMVNCAVWGNDGGGSFYSGGIWIGGGSGTLALTNCTISGNQSNRLDPGAIRHGGASVELSISNCIIWGNSGPSLVREGAAKCDVSFSAIEGDAVCPGDRNIFEDPRFVSAGTYDFGRVDAEGFPDFIVEAPDFRLQPGSPCIDSGTPAAPSVDIDGNGRGCAGGVDMGAYEHGDCAAEARFERGNGDGNSKIDISDPIFLLNYLLAGGEAPGCLDASDVDDDGKLDTTDAIYSLRFQFLGGPAPEMPFPGCGADLWLDSLGCQSYPECQ